MTPIDAASAPVPVKPLRTCGVSASSWFSPFSSTPNVQVVGAALVSRPR